MNASLPYNDQPIFRSSEDIFGVAPFAEALAKSILQTRSPTGTVIALNGPWGSGKSSTVNLIRHHLDAAVKDGNIVIVDFACWWFRGEEALVLEFFRVLDAGLSPTLGKKLKKSLPKLGARLLKAGAVLGSVADLAGAGGFGGVAGRMMERFGKLESVEKLHTDLSTVLREQKRRFLIVIDDIDRLSPDEVLLIFRLVKSVGRLPNVMYLLVYDRQLAERIVSERFPSEGPHYLEKIVQAAFELPEPMTTNFQRHLLGQIKAVCGEPSEERRFMNIFYDGVAPAMRTPRDAVRFTNLLTLTWPAVAGEVDLADFIALEVLRLRHPDVYRSVRQNKDPLCGQVMGNYNLNGWAKEYEDLLFQSVTDAQRKYLRNIMMRMFPLLEHVWGKSQYEGSSPQWGAERRVCSASHFDTYFRFAIGMEVLPAVELNALIDKAHDSTFIASEMRRAALVAQPSGETKASVILNDLARHAEKVDIAHIQPLLAGLFAVADEINEADQGRMSSMGNNERRLYWLLHRLTQDRLTLEERSKIYVAACQNASLGWLASFVDSATKKQDMTTAFDAKILQRLLGERIVKAAKDGSLIRNQNLALLLQYWSDLDDNDGAAVKQWTVMQLADDEAVRQFAVAFTSYGWIQGGGMSGLSDRVAMRTTHAQVKGLEHMMDVSEFRQRVENVAAKGIFQEVVEFLEAWKRHEQGSD